MHSLTEGGVVVTAVAAAVIWAAAALEAAATSGAEALEVDISAADIRVGTTAVAIPVAAIMADTPADTTALRPATVEAALAATRQGRNTSAATWVERQVDCPGGHVILAAAR